MKTFKLYHENNYLGELTKATSDFNSTKWETDVQEALDELNLDVRNFEHLNAFHLEETGDFNLYQTQIRIMNNAGYGKYGNYGKLTKKNIQDVIKDLEGKKEMFEVRINNKTYDDKTLKEFLR